MHWLHPFLLHQVTADGWDTSSSTCYFVDQWNIFTLPARVVANYCDEHICLRAYLWSHTWDLYEIFEHVAYRRGSVLLKQGGEIPRGRGSLGVFLPIYNAF